MSRPFLLISEARGEFLVVEAIRRQMESLGRATIHVTVRERDLSEAERTSSGAIVLESHPAFAAGYGTRDVAGAVRAQDAALQTNLRRMWKADLRSWREGASDDEMARLTLGYLRAWSEILEAADPLSGMWGEDGGHLGKRTGFAAAATRGTPVWFIYVAPLPDRLLVLDNPLNRFPRAAFASVEPTVEEHSYASGFLEALRASRIQFSTPRDLSFGPGRVARFAKLLIDRYVHRPPGSDQLYPFTFARSYVRQRLTRGVLRRSYGPVSAEPFVFHPLHAGYDAQISIRAPQWEKQLGLVEHIAASLPYGYKLAIKEHPFEVGALPLGRLRSLLARTPEVELIDSSIHAHDVLRRSTAVTTVNSTVGFEALFFGRAVVTFGHSAYRALGLTEDVTDPFDTPLALERAIRRGGPSEDEIVRLVVFLHRNSFEGVSLAYDVGDENARRHAVILCELARRSDP
jgi:hypothetical protein